MSTTTNDPSVDVIIAGTVFCDLVFAGVDLPSWGQEVRSADFAASAGGVATYAVAAARLGASTALHARLGDDPLGLLVRDALATEPGLDLGPLVVDAQATAVSVAISSARDRSFVTHEKAVDESVVERGLESAAPARAALISLERDLPGWAMRMRNAGTRLYGTVGWDESGEWSDAVLRRLESLDAVVMNEPEALAYTGAASADAALRELARRAPLAVVTLGPDGAIALGADGSTRVEGVPATTLDPTGAGDVLLGALMATDRLDWPIEQRLRLAVLCASLSVESLGGAASAPRPEAIAARIERGDLPGDWTPLVTWVRTLTTSMSRNPQPQPLHQRSEYP